MVIDDILGECYKLDVLLKDPKALDFVLSAPYAQQQKEAAREKLSMLESVKDRCFISRKYIEYINMLLR